MQAVSGTVKDGKVVPDKPLPEGTRVEIFFHEALSPTVGSNAPDYTSPEVQADLDFWYRATASMTNGAGALPAPAKVNGPGSASGAQPKRRARDGSPYVFGDSALGRPSLDRRKLQNWGWGAVLGGISLAFLFAWSAVQQRGNGVIRQRTIKDHVVEMTADTRTDSVGAMRALAAEVDRSPTAREIVLHFGQPRSLLIYDRQNKSLTSIPGTAAHVAPCSAFVSGPFFNQVTDAIVHRVVASGDGIEGLSRYCGAPGKAIDSGCA